MTYQPDVVIYHSPCADGFGAAWSAWIRWRDACQYVPATYGQAPPDVTGKHVLIADFSYKRDVLIEMGRKAASIIILDHHKTAQADLADWAIDDVAGEFWAGDDPLKLVRHNDEFIGQPIAALFDMNRSGARMTWDFCHDDEAPMLVRLIEDRDLWRFALPETKPFSLWLRSHPYDFDEWEMIAQELNDGRDSARIFAEAGAVQRFFDQKVAEMVMQARWVTINGHNVPAVNCSWAFASDVAHELLKMFPNAAFAACYYDRGDGSRSFSLRSEDHRQDVSTVAKRYGGGGHRNAAGFEIPA